MYPQVEQSINSNNNNGNGNNSNGEGQSIPLIAKPQPGYQTVAGYPPAYAAGAAAGGQYAPVNTYAPAVAVVPIASTKPNSRLGHWLNTTTPMKRNCCYGISCLFITGTLLSIVFLSLALACLNTSWNGTRNFEINMSTNPITTLKINVKSGDVFIGVSPTPSNDLDDQIIRIENRIYSQYRNDADNYQVTFFIDGNTAFVDADDSAGDNEIDGCVRPEVNVILPYGSSMQNFNIEISAEWGSEIRVSSYSSLILNSLRITVDGGTSPIYLDQVSATSIYVDTENRPVRTIGTSAVSATIRSKNGKINMVDHVVDNSLGSAVLTLDTDNARVDVEDLVISVPNSTVHAVDINVSTKNDKVHLSHSTASPFIGSFSFKTKNGKVNIDTDTSDVVYTKTM